MTDPRIARRRVLVARELAHARRRVVVVALSVPLLVALGIVLVHSSVFGASSVRISGSAHVSRERVMRTAGLTGSPPLVDLSARLIATRVGRLPWVKSAAVSISFPSTVSIRITSRTEVAAAVGEGGVAVLDPSGHVLEDVSARPRGLPLIKLAVPAPAPGGRVGRFGQVLTALAAAMPERMVGEVARLFYGPEGGSARLVDGVEAVFGSAADAHAKFVSLATVLARVSLVGISEVDLRSPADPVLIR